MKMFIDDEFPISKERLVLLLQNSLDYIIESVGNSGAKRVLKNSIGLDRNDLMELGYYDLDEIGY